MLDRVVIKCALASDHVFCIKWYGNVPPTTSGFGANNALTRRRSCLVIRGLAAFYSLRIVYAKAERY
jgi:hypothetical protein